MIEIKNIKKSFGDHEVLKGVSAVFDSGKCNLIIGKSGSGKTVTLKCMVGLYEPDSGAILYDGRNVMDMDFKERKAIRREIGMLFQGTALFDSMTVHDNIAFPLNMFTTMTEEEKRERVNFCLKRVNMENTNKKYPGDLSGGMKKRVGIARAIALNTKYLFCDEPNTGLDPITSRVIDELLTDITQDYNITTVINSHDMKTVYDIGNNIIFIYKGQKWWQGNRTQIDEARHENPELDNFIKASQF